MCNDVREAIGFTEELELAIAKRAIHYGRSFSAQVAYDMSIIIERAKHRRRVVDVNNLPRRELDAKE